MAATSPGGRGFRKVGPVTSINGFKRFEGLRGTANRNGELY